MKLEPTDAGHIKVDDPRTGIRFDSDFEGGNLSSASHDQRLIVMVRMLSSNVASSSKETNLISLMSFLPVESREYA